MGRRKKSRTGADATHSRAARPAAADLVVVGGGGAGLTATLEAASLGRSVVLLEKAEALGGSSGRSVGSITANCTPHQVREGIQDSPEAHAEDMAKVAGDLVSRDNPVLRDMYAREVVDTFRWLMELGLTFYGPMPEEPHRYPRMHTILPNSGAYIYRLQKEARALGAEIVLNARAKRLLTADGRITGVVADVNGREVTYEARRGVVLTTGDFSNSRELKSEFLSPARSVVEGITETSTGDGHRMAREHGAYIINGDLAYGPEIRFVAPTRRMLSDLLPGWKVVGPATQLGIKLMPPRLFRAILMKLLTTNLSPSTRLYTEGAILVNREGRRFTDELGEPAVDVVLQTDGDAFLVFDHRLAGKFEDWPYFVSTAPGVAYAYLSDYRRSRRDIFHSAETPESLAEAAGIDLAGLAATFAELRAASDVDGPASVTKPPFYALGPARGYIPITDGGLAVNANLAVIREDGSVIEGLYAAGSAGQGGVLLEGHGHHLGWALVSGRVAARSAVWGSERRTVGSG